MKTITIYIKNKRKCVIPNIEQTKRKYYLTLNNLEILAGYLIEEVINIVALFDFSVIATMQPLFEEVFFQKPDNYTMFRQRNLRKTQVETRRGALSPTASLLYANSFISVNNKMKLDNRNDAFTPGLNLLLQYILAETKCKCRKDNTG
jgi:hypothetical protein